MTVPGLGATSTSLAGPVARWLAHFERACAGGSAGSFAILLEADSYWRDLLAFTWDIQTLSGHESIVTALGAAAPDVAARDFHIDPKRAPPRLVIRAGTRCIEAFFRFETRHGRGGGVLRLRPEAIDSGISKAWTLLTTLEALSDDRNPAAVQKSHGRDFRGPNWLDLRRETAAYVDRDPTVIVVGAGQAGLAVAARLNVLGVDTLVVDRGRRVGDNWRNRYHALTLHNQTHVNHMPFMPFPDTWPSYIPKDKLAAWLEAYAEAMEINCWTETEFEGGSYDVEAGRWSVTLRKADGANREMRPHHLILATGVSGIPHVPDIPTLRDYGGRVLHASQYQDGEAWSGKSAIVIGTGNSGHDIVQDLYSGGADVTLVQRSSTLVVNLDTAQLPYALYSEGMSTEDCDLVAASMPLQLARKSHQHLTAEARILDAQLLDGLEKRGFRLDFGDEGTGWQFKYLTRGGGYYFNVGCSELIAEGKVRLLQHEDIAGFAADGARLKDGSTLSADLIVLATGYKGQEHLLRKLFGEEVATRVGPVWGFGKGLELRNMYAQTPQQGLWFIAGSLAQCRIYSKYLALQITAMETGVLAPRS